MTDKTTQINRKDNGDDSEPRGLSSMCSVAGQREPYLPRPRLGLVTAWFERGAAYVSRAYYQVLSPQFDVRIYARGGESYAQGDRDWDGEHVTWAKRKRGGVIDLEDFHSWLKNTQVEVLIFNEQQDWDVILAVCKANIAMGSYVDYYTPVTVPFFELYDFLLCNTNRHYQAFCWHPHALHIPWGTDCSLFRPDARKLDRRKVVFFHSAGMGGVNLRKGTDLLVAAFQKLDRRDSELVIHSQAPLSRYGRQLARAISEHPRIEFVHRTVPAPGLYGRGDVYVYPTRLEGIGLTVPEALACGLPVITTDAPPMNEFVRDGYNGLLVRVAEERRRSDDYYWPESVCSIDDLAAKMAFFCEQVQEIPRFAANARESACDKLDWQRNAQRLPSLLTSIPVNPDRRAAARRLQPAIRRYQESRWPYTSKRYRVAMALRRMFRSVKAAE